MTVFAGTDVCSAYTEEMKKNGNIRLKKRRARNIVLAIEVSSRLRHCLQWRFFILFFHNSNRTNTVMTLLPSMCNKKPH
ncbi:hypothetical protein CKO_03813 [Citrobacter koseri ATCC BAA-895]|uniref:Uncharacterized protein n=1 Tax=Citrobacter koseri (strain ATCC BAA-895 / CDC 4225-83 / SGSC4696) TaxID=290338 RepID=A8AN27_CITK8|nr:hypothetical protein CKO_03813 [Citrobacter koseri ATCC BAA-895]